MTRFFTHKVLFLLRMGLNQGFIKTDVLDTLRKKSVFLCFYYSLEGGVHTVFGFDHKAINKIISQFQLIID